MIFNWDWHSWKKGKYKKPYIEKGPHFNISHSGKMVVVCFSKDAEVGVDIEQIKEIDTKSMSSNFHKDEITWLENNSFQLDQFYTVWTRKEAFLKAKGQGLMEGMDQLSILNDQVMDETEWHLREIDVFSGYKCCLCSSRESSEVTITQIDYNTLNKFIDEKILL
jgi:4'-phosphopantetheinyl transferase